MERGSPEPIPLTQPAHSGLRDSWFDGQPRHSVPPSTSMPPPPPLPSRGRTIFAGALVGAVAASAGVFVARALSAHMPYDVVKGLARTVSRGDLRGLPEAAWAFGTAGIVGLLLGVAVALLTRHVRRALPLTIFGMIFAPVLWLGVHVLSVRHHPWLALALPIGPMLIGCAAFGLLLGLVIPLRGR